MVQFVAQAPGFGRTRLRQWRQQRIKRRREVKSEHSRKRKASEHYPANGLPRLGPCTGTKDQWQRAKRRGNQPRNTWSTKATLIHIKWGFFRTMDEDRPLTKDSFQNEDASGKWTKIVS